MKPLSRIKMMFSIPWNPRLNQILYNLAIARRDSMFSALSMGRAEYFRVIKSRVRKLGSPCTTNAVHWLPDP